MNTTFYEDGVFVDTSAIIALKNTDDEFHADALRFFTSNNTLLWFSLNATGHEYYTRARYDSGFEKAIQVYDWLLQTFRYLRFNPEDETQARSDLERFKDQDLSYHDALLAAVMKRVGVYKVFSFDHHFFCFGFEVLPGITK